MSDAAKAVFLSYAREDAGAARRIAEALRSHGLEVWFDENELRGGDAWDAKIRRQIDGCALFVPIISTHTDGRTKGYFRLEWKLAVEQTHLLAEGVPFIAPVVIDDTRESGAVVPAEFLRVQWTRLPGALPTPQFVEQIRRLLVAPRAAEVRRSGGAEGRTTDHRPLTTDHKQPIKWIAAAAIMLMVGIGGYFALRPETKTPSATSPAPSSLLPAPGEKASASAKSIAVLPFANLGGRADNEGFADGMHDDVITALTKIHDLRVISRTSVMTYKTGTRNLKQIAAELGVATVLEGSVQRSGGKVRLNVQLIDARTDAHLWAENYTEDLSDAFAVQSRLATAITTALQAKLSPQEMTLIARRPTANREAYELYQRAMLLKQSMGLGAPRSDFERMATLFEQALAKDPGFALAWAHFSILNGEMYWFPNVDPSPERRARAESALHTALRLAPSAPETLAAQGYFEYAGKNDWAGALAYYRRAQAGLPNDADLLGMIASAHRRLGQLPEAMAAFERAAALNPNDLSTVISTVQTAATVRGPRQTLELAQRYLALFPGNVDLEVHRIAAQYWLDGDRAAYLRELRALPPPASDTYGLGRAYLNALMAGDLAEAERVLADPRLVATSSIEVPVSLQSGTGFIINPPWGVQRAYVAYLQGRTELARQLAEQAVVALRAHARAPRQEPLYQIYIAMAESYAGRFESAVREAEAALVAQERRDAFATRHTRTTVGRIFVTCGRREEALGLLREVMSRPGGPIPDNIRHDPIWSRLKDDPRFEQILRAAEAAARKP